MATKKFSPAQIAAQKLFAERARAGTLKKDWLSGITPEHEDYDILRYYLDEKKNLPKTLGKGKRKPNPGLYENINAKRARIAAGSGEKMRKPGQAGRPTAEAFEQSAMTAKRNPIMGPVQTKRVIKALEETQAALSRATRYSPENQDKDLIDFYKNHIAKLTKAIETGFFISDDRFSNRRANPDKANPRAYVKRASQITGAPPSKRLQTRRKMALKAPAGYFPNPKTMQPYTVYHQGTRNVAGRVLASGPQDAKKKVAEKLGAPTLSYLTAKKGGTGGTGRELNPITAAMMTGYQVIGMLPKKNVVGIFKTMARAKNIATFMADANGVPYGVKTVKVHKTHFAV